MKTLSPAQRLPMAVECDPIRLRQILLNLLSNAIKFTPGGSVLLEVDQIDQSEKSQLRFRVRDTGCGMKSKDLERIFQPFAQAGEDKVEQTKGTGLGLAICRRLSDAMAGTIDVQSELGQGSCFTVTIPMREVMNFQPEALHNAPVVRNDALQGRTILVAEDMRATRYVITRLIEDVGGKATVVEDGEQLFNLIESKQMAPDVIVTDLQMPKLNGLELTQRLRQQQVKTPIIVLTADAIGETREAAFAAGADDLVTKPIDRTTFLQTLVRWCEA